MSGQKGIYWAIVGGSRKSKGQQADQPTPSENKEVEEKNESLYKKVEKIKICIRTFTLRENSSSYRKYFKQFTTFCDNIVKKCIFLRYNSKYLNLYQKPANIKKL